MSLNRELREMARHLRRGLEDAQRLTLDDLHETAQKQSSGRLSAATQQARGPFYSRAQGARANPDIINEWDGIFKGNWRKAGPRTLAGALAAEVWNQDLRAPAFEAGEVAGQPLMVERHPEEAAAREVEPRFEKRCEVALERVLG